MRLNLKDGQQCVRDFFICLYENVENWFDVYSLFSLNMVFSTTCIGCGKVGQSEQNRLHIEMDVPTDGSKLNKNLEEILHGPTVVEYHCKEGCKMKKGAENRSMIKSCKETQFVIVILRRVVQGAAGPILVQSTTDSTEKLQIRYFFFQSKIYDLIMNSRDFNGYSSDFEPISLIEHKGFISEEGQSQGHYICDVKCTETQEWLRTDDNHEPMSISLSDVTKKPVVVLYRNVNYSQLNKG